MKFYLGTHRPYWLWKVNVPLFVSRRTLSKVKNRGQALAPWALDSGGFTELSINGKWTITAQQYAKEVKQLQEIGQMKWAAPQDWMCEPWIIEKTGLSVIEHQRRTVLNYLELLDLGCPVIPVLQGWTMDDYKQCADLYEDAGVELAKQHTVGLGSVCRRQATAEIGEIAQWGHHAGYCLHGFGVKSAGIKKYGQFLASADSLAWSYTGRFHPEPLCEKKTCANCLHYALSWREKVIK
jgi:hypothetical protein